MPLSDADIAELFRCYGHMVFRRALRVLGDQSDAEEATQEVFALVIGARIDTLPDNPVAWLYTITTRHCLNVLRNRKRRKRLMSALGGRAWALPTEAVSPADLAQLRAILARANPQQAQAATHVFFDGMTHREVGEVMGISKSSVTNLIARLQKAVSSWT